MNADVELRRSLPWPVTDEADKALILRTHNGLQHTAASEGCLPVRLVDEVVQLNQINVVGTKPLERPGDLRVRVVTPPLSGLVARKKSDRYVSIHGPILSSASP